jgi:hypothetical protein
MLSTTTRSGDDCRPVEFSRQPDLKLDNINEVFARVPPGDIDGRVVLNFEAQVGTRCRRCAR